MKSVIRGSGRETAVLLHGGGLGPWSCAEAARRFADAGFLVDTPALDGHAGGGASFASIGESAEALLRMIDEAHGGHVKLIAGLSLGGQILLEALCRRGDICDYAVAESALAIPMPMTARLAGPAARWSHPLVRRRWFARLQFRSLRLPEALFADYARDTAALRRDDLAAILRANAAWSPGEALGRASARLLIVTGGRETRAIRRSAALLRKVKPDSEHVVYEGLRHGEASIAHAEQFAADVLAWMNRHEGG